MKTGASFPSTNGHATKGLLNDNRGKPSNSILRAIDKHAATYVGLTAIFAICVAAHRAALAIMEASHRQFAVMNDRTVYAMGLIDCVAANRWAAVAYAAVIVAAVAFAQYRRHPAWSTRLTALFLCLPCGLYCWKCLYIVLKF
jgi:hypothetical protein